MLGATPVLTLRLLESGICCGEGPGIACGINSRSINTKLRPKCVLDKSAGVLIRFRIFNTLLDSSALPRVI